MQKMVYLLQVMGCPLNADYALHHYGPYSQDVARLTDEMVQAKLLDEQTCSNAVGQYYSYSLSASACRSLEEIEKTSEGQDAGAKLKAFLSDKQWLLDQDLRDLEYAATIVFFHEQGHDWPSAVEKMCQFKGLTNGGQIAERANALARRVVA
jgi:uncharacterized protein YwgA